MPFKYEKIAGFAGGLINRVDPRDIKLRDPRGLSKAQNISLDVGGKIRTIGGLADFTKVDGATALTQTAKLCPGSGLFTYGSDHWRGTDTVVDLLPDNNAVSDQQTEANATTGWAMVGGGTGAVFSSNTPANFSIGASGTTYVFGMVGGDATGFIRLTSGLTTVIGQRYLFSIRMYNTANVVQVLVGSITAGSSDLASLIMTTIDSWVTVTGEFVAITTTTYFATHRGATNSYYIDNVYLTKIPKRDINTDWLALADVADADGPEIDLYNTNDDSFTAGLLDFGTVSSFVGASAGDVDFPTVSTITDAAATFLSQGVKAGDVRIVSGCSTTAANNIVFVVERVTTGTIYARGSPFTVTAAEAGTVTLTKYNPVAFHYVNEALRASPADGGIALRPKHYSFADRTHFEGADSSERKFSSWYANDVGPVAPTDVAFDAAVDSGLSGNLTAGAGWEVGMTETADGGEWVAGTYIIACSFIYDDGQESALYVPSTDVAMTAITEGASLTLCAKADTATNYNQRISGGRVYCRLDETDDPWMLLMDISMAKGARATLSGTYNAWAEGATADDVYTASFISKRQNIDSYESLAGIDPTTPVEVFTGDNAFWNTSVIARNRCFIGAPRYTAEGGALAHFRDRILYSTVGAFDTFPIDNYIDVVQGDAEDYVKLGAYGNTLLAFKESTLYLIDISDPDDAGWQMKQDANEGKYPFRGIAHPGAYFETPVGPAWCNKFGVFLYNGSEIVELLGDKIELSEHPLAYQRYMEFDGSNDYVTKSNDADLNFGANTDFSLESFIKTSATSVQVIVNKADTTAVDQGYELIMLTDGTLRAILGDNSAQESFESTTAINDGEWHHVVVTFDRDSATGGVIYIDGVADGTPGDLTNVTGDIDVTGKPLVIGIDSTDLAFGPFDGSITHPRIWNRALTSAEIALLYAGQPVLAADQWGSQTDITPTGQAWSDSNTEGNSVAGLTETLCTISSVTAAGETPAAVHAGTYMVKMALAAGSSYCGESFATVIGEKYRAAGWCYVPAGTGGFTQLRVGTSSNNNDLGADSYTTRDAWVYVQVEYTPTQTTTYISFINGAPSGNMYVDDVVNVEIGCVAEYAPKGIGDATWVDQSGNSLDGTVVGATAIFEDSWAKFYTDYSILGYHALTNQIIIMRDCTGKWSSGQDYGDAFIIDLDTGAITTGRRVFTKGIAYSNWATDWEQNLIIAEQTSSSSVTIKKWTDEPQSQAIGLIDVRTADIDFGNPMFAKIFDALAAYYKSSAAQTAPFSYALDSDDRHVAWTRITGNFAAESFWEKLTLEPTAFECDTIRFKLDNPTAAGIMELNDLTLRYQTEEEDID